MKVIPNFSSLLRRGLLAGLLATGFCLGQDAGRSTPEQAREGTAGSADEDSVTRRGAKRVQPASVDGSTVSPPSAQDVATVLRIALAKREYHHLDTLQCEVAAPRDGFLYLFAVWTDGKVYLLWPHKDAPDARVRSGQVVRVSGDDGDPIVVTFPEESERPFVTEHLFAVLSPQWLDGVVVDPDHVHNPFILGLNLISPRELLTTRGGKRAKPLPVILEDKNGWLADSAAYTLKP